MLLLTFTAVIDTLKPPKCFDGSNECGNASTFHLTILYAALALAYLGNGGTRFTIGSMGANQFDKPNHQAVFFNWYTFALYTSNMIGSTVLLYIEENVSWVLGFAICVAFNILGLAIFLSGRRFYRHIEPQQESPFMSLAQVVVAAIRKHREPLSLGGEDYYHGMKKQESSTSAHDLTNPSKFFRYNNTLPTQNYDSKHIAISSKGGPTSLLKVVQLKSFAKKLYYSTQIGKRKFYMNKLLNFLDFNLGVPRIYPPLPYV